MREMENHKSKQKLNAIPSSVEDRDSDGGEMEVSLDWNSTRGRRKHMLLYSDDATVEDRGTECRVRAVVMAEY